MRFLRRKTPTFLLLAAGAVVLVVGLASGRIAEAGPGHHVKSETPGSNQAVIFSPFGALSADDKASWEYFKAVVQEQSYVVTEYIDATESADNNPGGATAANFLNLSQKGLVYVVSHGDTDDPGTPGVEPNLLLVEAYNTAAARNAALAAYGAPFVAGDLVACDQFADHAGNNTFGICITEQGVSNRFADKDSIVHIAACFSFNFKEEFNAREYFGYDPSIPCPTIRADTELLWGRMHGDKDDGTRRPVSRAFTGAPDFSAGFRHQHKAGVPLDTVLSPAVEDHEPPDNATIAAPITVPGQVIFDTKMDTTVAAAAIIEVTGCDAAITNSAWVAPYTLNFMLNLNTPGTATIDVNWVAATAERDFKNNLDGNRASRPPLRDHVGLNKDIFSWEVNCGAPVGGTVQLIGQSESPADASESSARDYAAPIAAAVAVAVAVLAAGGWYVRRRWLR